MRKEQKVHALLKAAAVWQNGLGRIDNFSDEELDYTEDFWNPEDEPFIYTNPYSTSASCALSEVEFFLRVEIE